MVWLFFETLVLLAVFTFAGIPLGIILRRSLAGGPRLAVAGGAAPLSADDGVPEFAPLDPAPAPRIEPRRAPDPVAEPDGEAFTQTEGVAVVDASRAAVADQVGVRPRMLSGARDGRPDDLKRIKGIGPQNETRLNALGIHHFDQIAAWTPEEARWVGSYLAFPGRIEREEWIAQAKELAGS